MRPENMTREALIEEVYLLRSMVPTDGPALNLMALCHALPCKRHIGRFIITLFNAYPRPLHMVQIAEHMARPGEDPISPGGVRVYVHQAKKATRRDAICRPLPYAYALTAQGKELIDEILNQGALTKVRAQSNA